MNAPKKKMSTAKKRLLQNESRRKKNTISKAKVKSALKELSVIDKRLPAVTEEKGLAVIEEEREIALSKAQKNLDKAARKGAISQGRSNRIKSRISRKK